MPKNDVNDDLVANHPPISWKHDLPKFGITGWYYGDAISIAQSLNERASAFGEAVRKAGGQPSRPSPPPRAPRAKWRPTR